MSLIYRDNGFLRNLDGDSASAYTFDGRVAIGNISAEDDWALSVCGNTRLGGQVLYMSSEIINLGADSNQVGGVQARTFGSQNVTLGNNTIAAGLNTQALGDQSVTLGEGTVMRTTDGLAVGRYNTTSANVLFVVGSGTQGSPSDALTVLDNGTVVARTLQTAGALTVTGPLEGTLVGEVDPDGSTNGLAVYSGSRTQIYSAANVSIGFSSNTSPAVRDAFVFTPDGRLGVGTIVPKANLSVAGNAAIYGDMFVHGNTVQLNANDVNISDPVLLLAANSIATGATTQDVGFVGERAGGNVAVVWSAAKSEFAMFTTSQGGTTRQFTDVNYANLHINSLSANTINVTGSAAIGGKSSFSGDVAYTGNLAVNGVTAAYLTLTQAAIPSDSYINFVPGQVTDPFAYSTNATYSSSNQSLNFVAGNKQTLNLDDTSTAAVPLGSVGWSFIAALTMSSSQTGECYIKCYSSFYGQTNQLFVSRQFTNVLNFYMYDASNRKASVAATIQVPTSECTIAATFDPLTDPADRGILTLYFNGAQVAQTNLNQNADAGCTMTDVNWDSLIFGGVSSPRSNLDTGYYQGALYHCQLYNRALTATEVATITGLWLNPPVHDILDSDVITIDTMGVTSVKRPAYFYSDLTANSGLVVANTANVGALLVQQDGVVQGNLTTLGQTGLVGNVFMSNNVTVGISANVQNALNVGNVVTTGSDVFVGNSVVVPNTTTTFDLLVSNGVNVTGYGNVNINGPVNIYNNNLTVSHIDAVSLEVGSTAQFDSGINVTYGGATIQIGGANIQGDVSISPDQYTPGSLAVSGDTMLSQDAYVVGNLTSNTSAYISGDTTVGGNVFVGQTLSVLGNAILVGYANVVGDTAISGNVAVGQSLTVTGNTFVAGTANIQNLQGHVSITGSHGTIAPGGIPVGLSVLDPTVPHNSIYVGNALTTDASGYFIYDDGAFAGIPSVLLGVTGTNSSLYILSNNVTETTGALVSDALRTNAVFSSRSLDTAYANTEVLSATVAANLNTTTVRDTLTVIGNIVANSSLVVGNSGNIYGSLTVGQATTMTGSLSVLGAASVNNTLNVSNNTLLGGNLAVVGNATVVQSANIHNNLMVGNTFTLQGPFTASGAAIINNTLSVYGNTTLAQNASVLNNLFVGNSGNVAGSLVVGQAANVWGPLSVSGAILVSNTLTVSNGTVLNGNLVVLGNTYLQKNANIANNLTVGGATALSGALLVAQAATLQGAVVANNTLTVLGNATLAQSASVQNTLTVGGNISVPYISSTTSNSATINANALTLSSSVDTPIAVNTTYSGGQNGYSHMMSMINRNAAVGEATVVQVGQALTSYGAAYMGYVSQSFTSNSYLTLGLFSQDRILNVTGNRNVGVNTTTPQNTLDVSGSVHVSSYLQVGDTAATDMAISALQSNLGAGAIRGMVLGQSSSLYNRAELWFTYAGSSSSNNSLTLGLYGTPTISVWGSGNVGVNVTSAPAYQFTVNGTLGASSVMCSSLTSTGAISGPVSATTLTASANTALQAVTATSLTSTGNISGPVSATTLTASGNSSLQAINTTSINATSVTSTGNISGPVSATTLNASGNSTLQAVTTANLTSTGNISGPINATTINASGNSTLQNVTISNLTSTGNISGPINATTLIASGNSTLQTVTTGNITATGAVKSNAVYVSGVDSNSRSLVCLANSSAQNAIVWGQSLASNGSVAMTYNAGTNPTCAWGMYGSPATTLDGTGTLTVPGALIASGNAAIANTLLVNSVTSGASVARFNGAGGAGSVANVDISTYNGGTSPTWRMTQVDSGNFQSTLVWQRNTGGSASANLAPVMSFDTAGNVTFANSVSLNRLGQNSYNGVDLVAVNNNGILRLTASDNNEASIGFGGNNGSFSSTPQWICGRGSWGTQSNWGLGCSTGSGILFATTNGNVGIQNSSPQLTLDVGGVGRFYPSSSLAATVSGLITQNVVQGAADVGIGFQQYGVNSYGIVQRSGGATSSNTSAGRLSFVQNLYPGNSGTEQLTILQNGNVGIATTSPVYTLDVYGTIRAYGTSLPQIILGDQTPDSSSRAICALSSTMATGSFRYITLGVSQATNNQAEFSFYYSGSGSSSNRIGMGLYGAERMSILGNGNVGFNNTSPGYTLDVNGAARLGAMYSIGGTSPMYIGCVSAYTGSGNTFAMYQGSAGDTVINAASGQTIEFKINNAEYMRVHSNSYVGINQPAPAYQLDVNGNLNCNGTLTGIGAYFQVSGGRGTAGNNLFHVNGTTGVTGQAAVAQFEGNPGNACCIGTYMSATSQNDQMVFHNPNGRCGSIQTTNSSTSFNTSSDYRLKDHRAPYTNGLELVNSLKPTSYVWKTNHTPGVGFIAHEVQALVPDAVSGEKDEVDDKGVPQYQGVDYSKLVVYLVSAVQDLSQQVKSLQLALAAK